MSAVEQVRVFERARRNTVAKWPGVGSERLRPWCTPNTAAKFTISSEEIVFTIGSCFARNIEEHLSRLGVKVPAMEFSVPRTEYEGRSNGIINKYTPPSILNELRFASNDSSALALDDHFIDAGNSTVIDLHLNSYHPVPLDRARERRHQVRRLFDVANAASVIIITLGLTEAWYDTEKSIYINDAPPPRLWKSCPGRFEFKVLTYDECFETMRQVVELLNRCKTPKKIVLTVSPVPLGRTFTEDDVIVANANSKATLRAVAGAIAARFANAQYFPSYEIATISAPEQVWSPDQIHLRDDAVGRIVEAFLATFWQFSGHSDPHRRHFAARLALSGGDAETAYARLKALDAGERGLPYLSDLIEACDRTSRYDEALETAQRLTAIRPERGGNWHLVAQMAIKAGMFEIALDAAGRAMAIEPGIPVYHANRGFILDRLGRALEAADEAETAARLVRFDDPDQQILWRRLATRALELMLKAGLVERASDFFTELCSFTTEHPPLLHAASRIFVATGDLNRAVAYAKQEAAVSADFAALRHYGTLCLRARRHAEAASALGQALELRPADAPTMLQLFVALEGCGRGDEVLALAAEYRATGSAAADLERWLVNFESRHKKAFPQAPGMDPSDLPSAKAR